MNTSDVLFHERQRFTQWWIYLVGGILPLVGVTMMYLLAQGPPWLIALVMVPTLLLLTLRLDVEVTPLELRVRFFPLLRKQWTLDQISSCEARTYRPVAEYGGWGIRYGFGHGWAYNVKGNRGVQLVLTDGTKVLIGSQRPEELEAAIGRR